MQVVQVKPFVKLTYESLTCDSVSPAKLASPLLPGVFLVRSYFASSFSQSLCQCMIRIPPQNTLVERKASNFTLPSPNLSNLCGGVFPVQTNCIGMLAIKLIGGEFKKKGKERKKKNTRLHRRSQQRPRTL